jgi:hypothetical protein
MQYRVKEKTKLTHIRKIGLIHPEFDISKLDDLLSVTGFQIGVCRVAISWKAEVATATLSAIKGWDVPKQSVAGTSGGGKGLMLAINASIDCKGES